jgi:ribosomal protein L40E
MGKFPEADAEIASVQICLRCKRRNPKTVKKCRACGSGYLRPKRKEIRAKK